MNRLLTGVPDSTVRSSRWERLLLWASAGMALSVLVVVHPGELYIDTLPDLYLNPGRLIGDSLSTWVGGTGLGTPSYNTGYLPIAVVVWLLNQVSPPWLAMRLWRFLLLVVAALGARAFLRDLAPAEVSWRGRVAVAVLYAANPYVIVGAATTPIMVPYAVFPWLLLALRRSFTARRWWRGAAAFGLGMFAMGGINAGVVPAFLVLGLVPVTLDAHFREGVPWRRLLRGLAVSGVATALVSAYWLVATAGALSTASQVAQTSEDPTVIARVSSYAESLRGLGSWLMYGADQLGPYRPGFVPYLHDTLVVVGSFTAAVLGFLGATVGNPRLRRVGVGLLLLGLVVMVGGFPPDDPAPYGRAFLWAMDHVPGAIAFRTTNKAGAIAMLGLAVLGALAVDWLTARRRRGVWASVAALGLMIGLTPAWLGNLLPGELPVPQYWQSAASDLDGRNSDGRVLALPGEANASYRWRPLGVDDFSQAYLSRPLVYSRNYPDSALGSWSSLTSVTNGVGQPGSAGRLLSTYSAYTGVSDVLVRNDMLWELMGAPRPEALVSAAEHDPGLAPSAFYGLPGQNMTPTGRAQLRTSELTLPPLLRYSVKSPTAAGRAYSTRGQLLVAGDNQAFPTAVWAGLLDGNRGYRLLGQDAGDPAALVQALREGGRLVLTDTNRRHAVNVHRLDQTGPLVTAGESPSALATIGATADQTVAEYAGVRGITATRSGSIFGPTPDGRPFLAFDGDPDTGWNAGDYGAAVGQSIAVRLAAAQPVTTVAVERPDDPSTARAASIEVSAGGRTATATFGTADTATVRFDPAVTADSVTVTIRSLTGRGPGGVRLREILIPGVHATETDRLPTTISDLARNPSLAPLIDAAPLDVLLTRASTEGEVAMNRTFVLPARQEFDLHGEARLGHRWKGCRSVGTLDHTALTMRVTGKTPDGWSQLAGCRPLTVDAGRHHLASAGFLTLDRLALQSRTTPVAPADPATSLPTVIERNHATLTVPAANSARMVVLAESFDPRWRATLDGRDLGAPQQVNGFALGWEVPAGEGGTLRLSFGPQGAYRVALGLSLATVLALAGALVVPLLWGLRRRFPRRGRS